MYSLQACCECRSSKILFEICYCDQKDCIFVKRTYLYVRATNHKTGYVLVKTTHIYVKTTNHQAGYILENIYLCKDNQSSSRLHICQVNIFLCNHNHSSNRLHLFSSETLATLKEFLGGLPCASVAPIEVGSELLDDEVIACIEAELDKVKVSEHIS